ncbi:20807_t:CDS:2, partial [Rhizophagus irregularis]
PLAQSPLALRPISTPHFQSQNSSFEMTPNPNNLMGYGSGTIPYTEENEVSGEMPFNTRVFEIDDYSLQENDQLFNEEIIPIDILDGDFDTNDLMNFKENENGKKQSGKRKVSELQLTERWSDEETDKLLSYLEDNYEKLQQGKKAAYENVKKQNNQTGSERVDWKWFDIMDRIFGCRENINSSFLSNDSTEFIKSLVDVMNNINQSKNKLAEQKFELEREKMNKEYKLQSERLEVEKQKWEYEREQAHMRHELLMKQIELQIAQTQNKQ